MPMTPRLFRSQALAQRPDLARRALLTGLLATPLVASVPAWALPAPAAGAPAGGRLKQSVSRWPFEKIPLPEFCKQLKAMGFAAIDLLYQDEWKVAQDAGLVVSMGYASRRDKFIATGFNDPANHAMLLKELEQALPVAARAGVPSLIAMFGNRDPGIDDTTAARNCIAGLKKIAPLAEEVGVNVCMELLNSKVDHGGYQGDRTAFGVEVVKGVGSPRVNLLYDIYHMQIMEGDVISTIRDNLPYIGHFHTAGVPGRHELDDRQELNYRGIATAIADAGFKGYLAHEFMPAGDDPYASLAEAFRVCTV